MWVPGTGALNTKPETSAQPPAPSQARGRPSPLRPDAAEPLLISLTMLMPFLASTSSPLSSNSIMPSTMPTTPLGKYPHLNVYCAFHLSGHSVKYFNFNILVSIPTSWVLRMIPPAIEPSSTTARYKDNSGSQARRWISSPSTLRIVPGSQTLNRATSEPPASSTSIPVRVPVAHARR